ALAAVPGVYIPEWYRPRLDRSGRFAGIDWCGPGTQPQLFRRVAMNLDTWPAGTVIHTPHAELPGLHLIEISRGCPRECRFCLIPGCYSPFRYRSVPAIMDSARSAPPDRRIGLLGAGAADHPFLLDICRALAADGFRFSFSSLHATRITPELTSLIHTHGPRTVTLAPEAATDQRRRTLGKTLTNTDLIAAVQAVGRPPVKTIKVYFIAGLPGETAGDLHRIADLCRDLEDALREANVDSKAIPRITAGISCFVPKPLSRFERAPMLPEKDLKEKLALIADDLRDIREIRWTMDHPRWAVMQGLIARGDRRLGAVLAEAGKPGADWLLLMKQYRNQQAEYMTHPIRLRYPLPWDHLKIAVM
ncbi:radical SAM protein, partial [bacterium]|nr:radical SAM protein [candidate division CSSED10-310 bacterium]